MPTLCMGPRQLKYQKLLLRKKLRQKLFEVADALRIRKSHRIIKRLRKTLDFLNAANILTYVALPYEVQTKEFITKGLRDGKRIFVPCVTRRTRRLEIYRITNFKRDLRLGNYGILEPRRLKSRRGDAREMDLVIVPGLGFDRSGARLGRGGGYFDRFLKKAKFAVKVGVAFREQIVKNIPMGKNDRSVDFVITD